MSTVSISYRSLKDASKEAKAVSQKLNTYADSIERNVYKKLNKYDGSWSDNLSSAKSQANAKINALRAESERYSNYESNLLDLRDECERTDKAVRSKVQTLTATFKENNGIRNSKIENAISYFFTKVDNSTAIGRWLGDGKDKVRADRNYLKESIKEWYNYEGGKELIKGVVIGLLEVAIGVATVIGAILTGGALIVIIAGVVGGIIVAVNGVVNMINEGRAYAATQNNDPATGRRRSKLDTLQDTLRTEFDSKWAHFAAFAIDAVNLACAAVTFVSSCGKMLKNGYQWLTGKSASGWGQIFSKDTFSQIGIKMKDFGTKIQVAFKYHDWSFVKQIGSQMFGNMKENFVKEFFDFRQPKDGCNSIKHMLAIPKDLLKEGFTLSNILDVGITKVVLPTITVFTINNSDIGTMVLGSDGQMQWDFFKDITIDDFSSIIEKGIKIVKSPVFDGNSVIDSGVLDKLTSGCNIDISIPVVNIPNIEMPIMAIA